MILSFILYFKLSSRLCCPGLTLSTVVPNPTIFPAHSARQAQTRPPLTASHPPLQTLLSAPPPSHILSVQM